jgi:predicted RNase H-like nuclease (RuvC/YqgF family)
MINIALCSLPADEKAHLNRADVYLRNNSDLKNNFAITNLRLLSDNIINDKGNIDMSRTKKADDKMTTEELDVLIKRADDKEDKEKEDEKVVEEKREDVDEDKKDNKEDEEQREDEQVCEGCKALQEQIDGLKAMVEELGGEVRKYREKEDKEVEDKEVEQKRSLLKNRSQSVQSYLMKRSLQEVKDYCKNFVRTADAVTSRSMTDVKIIEDSTEKDDIATKTRKEFKDPIKRGFGIR